MSAHLRFAQAEAEHLARFRSKFHVQRAEFEGAAQREQKRAETMIGRIAAAAGRLLDLRDDYRQTQSRDALIEAKSVLGALPAFVLDDDPKLASSLKIVRAASAFGFDPKADRTLAHVIDLVKRSAYAVDAPRAVQFLSALQTFAPRPDDDIRSILENVGDGIRAGSCELLVHEIGTFLSALINVERELPPRQRARYTNTALLDSLTRHLVTFHPTATITDVARAAALLARVSSPHGRVVFYELQSRISREATGLTMPPAAALDFISAVAHLEPESATACPPVVFTRNLELDSDLAAPPSLGLTAARPIARRAMLSILCEAVATHAHLLSADDVGDAFAALRGARFHHEALIERLVSRAMHVVDSTGLFSMLKILDGVGYFRVRGGGAAPLFDKYAARICHANSSASTSGGAAAAAGAPLPRKHLLVSGRLSFNQCASILASYADAGEDHQLGLFVFVVEQMARMPALPRASVSDAQLVRALETIERLRLHRGGSSGSSGNDDHSRVGMSATEQRLRTTAVRAVGLIVTELFVNRGGLSPKARDLIEATERVVEAMLPDAEHDPELLAAIAPLVSE